MSIRMYQPKNKFRIKEKILLCSDGLTDMVDDSMIRDILIEEKNNINAANKLVETARKTVAVITLRF